MIEQVLEQYAGGRHYFVATGRAFNGKSETGGWAAVVQLREGGVLLHQKCVAAQQAFTTDHRMALRAAIGGISCLKIPLPAIILSDSKYLIQGMTEWLHEWKEARWHNSGGAVKNRDLWEELDSLQEARPELDWRSAQGHALHGLNETADALAKEAAKGLFGVGDNGDGNGKVIRKRHPTWFK